MFDSISSRNILLNFLDENPNLVNYESPEGHTFLQKAVTRGNIEAIKILLERGADINCRKMYFGTPLTLAVYFNRPDCVKLLLDHGADINLKDFWVNDRTVGILHDHTPLQLSIEKKHIECAKLLIEHGADLTIQNDIGETFINFFTDENFKDEILKFIEDISVFDIKIPEE